MARIIKKCELTPITKLFVVESPWVARNAQPGQFVVVRVHQRGERVPVTITDFDRERGTVTVVVQEVGKTTHLICSLKEGDEFLDFLGPLGQPVELPSEGHVVLVGGGFGAGAIYTLAKELRNRGVRVSTIVGARNKDLLILQDELLGVSHRLYPCTDDGSEGYHGFVTGKLEELIREGEAFTHCYAIGPLPMMRAVASLTQRYGVPCQVSLDPIMIDATGMCGACRVTVGGKLRFACVDGPFFDAHQVEWEHLVVRSKMYLDQERLAVSQGAGVR